MNLKTATALVTGGSSGIGQGIAEALIASGARVAITGRDKTRLDAAAKAAEHAPLPRLADASAAAPTD